MVAIRDFLEDTDEFYWGDHTLSPERESTLDVEFFGEPPMAAFTTRFWDGTAWVTATPLVWSGTAWLEASAVTVY